jgi:subtilisin
MARRHGGSVRHLYEHALNGFAFEGAERAARNLERHPGVTGVTADQPVYATSDVIPWGVTRIEAPTAQEVGYDGGGVRIAVLDTGVDPGHPALDVDEALGRNCVDADAVSTMDKHGHGTHVAGSASASLMDGEFVGVATQATIVPVKVLSDTGSGSWASVICGVDHVSANAGSIGVANMSLGGGGSAGEGCDDEDQPLRMAICASVMEEGVTYTVAAGNDGTDASRSVPAAYPEVITVSALDDNRCVRFIGGGPSRTECDEGLASFSNHGSAIDVIAPGVRIYSTVPGGGYGTKSGTSMAAPHVAGVAALMLAVDDELDPATIRDLLQSTGECPDGEVNSQASGACENQGDWYTDPDGIAEPLVNASRAAEAVGEPSTGGPESTYDGPEASFTYTCADLECTFTDTSTADDTGVLIGGWAWDFGDGSLVSNDQNPVHLYGEAGDYEVTLTVTDTEGGQDAVEETVSVVASGGGELEEPAGDIGLTATGYKVRGWQWADLSWSGATSTSVDVLRDGTVVATVDDTGSHEDEIDQRGGGSYAYQVCEAGTSTCSNQVTVEF